MKKYLLMAAALLTSAALCAAAPKAVKKQVTYVTTLHCKNCAKKIEENVSFEKGVKDLKTNVDDKTVTIVYDIAKTDTLKLGNAIRKLGYEAKVIEFKDTK